ncbi:hypothetical protein [Actinomadura decatromicini]|uniref:Band 7 domain-containing protein n=1 Tax=Actinomadura decatromicini TaxID=2604572 RepID=A0A5D3FWB6_9ACTN|nr:hypothetical protein [Actinomadura decatromicini]TYK52523.1 hypothetical protein FXF68_01745 [Actinomadura decatromicini]
MDEKPDHDARAGESGDDPDERRRAQAAQAAQQAQAAQAAAAQAAQAAQQAQAAWQHGPAAQAWRPPEADPAPREPSGPLIVDRRPARGVPPATAMPGRAFVFSDRDGQAVQLSATPRGWLGSLGAPRYEWRFEVDVGLRSDTFTATIPSRTDTARFIVTLEAEWSVTDPVRVVRRGLVDGARLVRSRLLAAVRSVGHGYRIDQISELETALGDKLAAGFREYPEGITVHGCYVTAEPDERSRAKLERIDDARVERQLSEEEVGALRTSMRSSSDLFLLYLAQDRNRVGDLIIDMRKHEEIKEERVIELFNKAVEQNIMQPAEINEMLRRLLDPIAGVFQPDGRTDMFGTAQLPAPAPATGAAPAPPPAIAGSLAADDDEEDVMPEELRQRAEDGVYEWKPMPWES